MAELSKTEKSQKSSSNALMNNFGGALFAGLGKMGQAPKETKDPSPDT